MTGDAPILEFDPDRSALVEPHRVVQRRAGTPERAVLCFFRSVIDRIAASGAPVLFELQAAHGVHPVYGVDIAEDTVGVFHPGVGAPLAGAFFEEAIGHGMRRFVGVGTAGGLVPDLTLDHVIVPDAALRDEGTSYHYASADRFAVPTPGALAALEGVLAAHGVSYVRGRTWTTDAFYRETKDKVARRIEEGCVTVEMEAAALFAIAAFREVELAMLLTASDDLSGSEWSGFADLPDHDHRESLFRLAAEAVLAL